MRYFYLCITDTRYGYGDTGTTICEFKKRHSGSIERVSEYRSIGYGYGWVSEVSVIHRFLLVTARGKGKQIGDGEDDEDEDDTGGEGLRASEVVRREMGLEWMLKSASSSRAEQQRP